MPESIKSESTMSETYRHFTRLFLYPHERIAVGAPAADAMTRYDELAKLGRAEGFVPFFLNLNDTVLESMVIAVSLEHDIIDDVETLTPEQVSAYTRAVLQRYRTARGAASAEEYGSVTIAQQLRRVVGDGEDTSEDDPDDFNLNELVDEFMSSDFLPDEESEADAPTLSALLRYELADEEDQGEMLLLQIPTDDPADIPAYLPFGGWNDCPNAETQLAFTHYWREKYGAIPAALDGADCLEFLVERPVTDPIEAKNLAVEQFAFCSDLPFQVFEDVEQLTEFIHQSRQWYFWWD
ncbi:hypothetical protein HMPREF2630_05405 [Rothia sp. HMSC072B03]|uniref:DUF4253 domain-containing protein n=1 Tax=Rothia sp. HMSC072B03 TaxID=1715109 RepID=UPI0008A53F12|nr:DUF4253 domain-containing protein [Rothia sp. HMSC072B03]OFM98410.1 hypothetical protein HMPREF2630_05405 [Rothia sp. HMSC072B03]